MVDLDAGLWALDGCRAAGRKRIAAASEIDGLRNWASRVGYHRDPMWTFCRAVDNRCTSCDTHAHQRHQHPLQFFFYAFPSFFFFSIGLQSLAKII